MAWCERTATFTHPCDHRFTPPSQGQRACQLEAWPMGSPGE